MRYELYYWPTIQGRGEFVRLALEDAGAAYVDVARSRAKGMGVAAMLRVLEDAKLAHPPFAPPFLKAGTMWISQTANILFFLGPRLGLAPADDAGRLWAHQLQLTIADLVAEAHDVHHPIAGSLYYEDQKREALRAAAYFTRERIPRFLGYFENVLARNPSGPDHLVGPQATYVDLSMFQVMAGLNYAFPRAMARAKRKTPRLVRLAERVAARPRLAAYLASPRRLPFNEQDVFRHYPELDAA
ncbi:MAG: glutathione S-transferase [Pseudomonadota bacterium]